MRLPPLSPMVPRLLVRSAAGYLARGEAAKAVPWAREAMRLSPADPDAALLLAYAEEQVRGTANR
jgi:Flp pilus assembly protein TadD